MAAEMDSGGGSLHQTGGGWQRGETQGCRRDNRVEHCRLGDLRSALTNAAPSRGRRDLTSVFRRDWNWEPLILEWGKMADADIRQQHCVDAGYGWGHARRPICSRSCIITTARRGTSSFATTSSTTHRAQRFTHRSGRRPDDGLMMDYDLLATAEGVMIVLPNTNADGRVPGIKPNGRKSRAQCTVATVDAAHFDFHRTRRASTREQCGTQTRFEQPLRGRR